MNQLLKLILSARMTIDVLRATAILSQKSMRAKLAMLSKPTGAPANCGRV